MIIDKNFGDISFAVCGDSSRIRRMQRRLQNITLFYAHWDLARVFNWYSCDIFESKGESTPLKLQMYHQKFLVFSHLLYSAYGVKISDEDMALHTKE